MAKTPIYNSQICLWKVIVTGCTEYFRLQGTTMHCKVLGFTGVYWGEGVQGGSAATAGYIFYYERKIISGGLFGSPLGTRTAAKR